MPKYTIEDAPPKTKYTIEDDPTAAPTSQPSLIKQGQNYFDELTKPEAFGTRPGVFGNAVTAASDLGAGFMGLASPLVHPQKTLETIGSFLEPITPGIPKDSPVHAQAAQIRKDVIRPFAKAPGETNGQYAARLGGMAVTQVPAVAAMAAGPKLTSGLMADAGDAMESGAGRIMNRTIGARKADFSRGANPGRAYLAGGGKPALTMGKLAENAGEVQQASGQRLGTLYSDATKSGMRFPVEDVERELNEPVDEFAAQQESPGGTGASPMLDEYRARLHPAPNPAVVGSGGYTPEGVFGLKRSIGKNARWNITEPTGLNDVRQEQVGRLGGMLTDQIPEAMKENAIYQGATRFARRASERAGTGQAPLTTLARRGAELAIGTGAGMATHHPFLGALPIVADSIPVRSSAAFGLYHAGRGLSALNPFSRLAAPAAYISRIPYKQPDEEDDEK